MAAKAAATPGAIALTLTSPESAMAANVIMTPITVPSSPRNGPPEMAMVSSTIWLDRLCCSRVMVPSIAARMASMDCGVRMVTWAALTVWPATRLFTSRTP